MKSTVVLKHVGTLTCGIIVQKHCMFAYGWMLNWEVMTPKFTYFTVIFKESYQLTGKIWDCLLTAKSSLH